MYGSIFFQAVLYHCSRGLTVSNGVLGVLVRIYVRLYYDLTLPQLAKYPAITRTPACKLCSWLFSASSVNVQKRRRDRSGPNNEIKPFPQLSDQFDIDEPLRRKWGFVFSHASRSSESILGALQWLRRFFALFEEDDIDVYWIVSEMIDWLKVCARTVLIQES